MNITFLIGNGFDIGVGMKSKFKDFFPVYILHSEQKKDEIKQLSTEIGDDFETWADFELQMGKYTEKFDPSESQKILDQFRDFEMEFMKYLGQEEEKLSFSNMSLISSTMLSALKNFYSTDNLRNQSYEDILNVVQRKSTERRIYNFISFNYTFVLESCLKTISDGVIESRKVNASTLKDSVGKIVHVHGTRTNGPIMGVCEPSQIVNQELANNNRFLRYFVKPRINIMHRNNQDRDAEKLISSSNIICIYGMSLGVTDKNWWQKILLWLKENTDHHLVIYNHDPNFSIISQFDWIDKEDSILDKLASYDDTKQIDVEALRKRIHIAVNKNIFSMDLAGQHDEIINNAVDVLKTQFDSLEDVLNKI